MELRRALLLFAVVLGLAAIATSISRPPERAQPEHGSHSPPAPRGPTAKPRQGQPPARVSFASTEPRTLRLEVGRPATVRVEVPVPGQVELTGLGLSAPAEPLTPAHFEVLATRPGLHEVRFTPASGAETHSAGTLRVVSPG